MTLYTQNNTKEFAKNNYIVSRTAAALTSVVVSESGAVKTDYFANETFAYAGLKATAVYNTGYKKDVTEDATWKAESVASYTVSAAGTVNVTATWSGETSSNYPVAVTVTTKELESIELSETALTGYKGVVLPKPATVTAHFIDNTIQNTENVTALATYDVNSVYSASSTAEQTITVSYTFGPNTETADYTVTLRSIANTLNTAYSVEKAREIIDLDQVVGNDLDLELAANKVYVVGRVTSVENNQIIIKDDADETKTLYLWKYEYGTGITSVEVGDLIKAYGNLTWYSPKYELNEGCEIVWKQPKVEIEVANKMLEVGDVWTIDATITPAAAPVTYSIKDGSDDCITLDGDAITATAEGTATIVATAAEYNDGVNTYLANSKEFTVTVTPAAVHTNVVILAKAKNSDNYYALKVTKSTNVAALPVEYIGGKVIVSNAAAKDSILWDRAERDGVATFYNAKTKSYLKGGTTTTLNVATNTETYTSWTWKTDGYYSSNPTTTTVRTFLHQGNSNNFGNYAASNAEKNNDGGYSKYATIYTGSVVIKPEASEDPISVAVLSDNSDVIIGEGVTLTVDADKTLDNLTVEAGGTVETSSNELTVINNLTIESEAGKSGQVIDVTNVSAANLYLDITLREGAMDAAAARLWYCISAPFNVNMAGGFFWGDGTPMVLNQDFQLFEYDGRKRATTGVTGWQRVGGVMKAGVAYLIGFDDENPRNQSVIRLKAMSAALPDANAIALGSYTGDAANSNWNGIANPTLHYIGLDQSVQAFNYETQSYAPYDKDDYNFVVGTPFFIQATGSISIEDADKPDYRAPRAQRNESYRFRVQVSKAGASRFDNQVYVRASEDATATFQTGRDMVSFNGTTSQYGALLWTENYGTRLAIEDAPLVNGQAQYSLGLSAPAAGTYVLSQAGETEGATLYLTQDGNIIWNLSLGAYEATLQKGVNSGYGLRLVVNPNGVATGMEGVQSDNVQCTKAVIDGVLYILRGGQMYDATGKAVR